MKTNQITRLVVLSLALSGLVVGTATAATVPDWVETTEAQEFADEIPGIVRPAVGVFTDYYTYGPSEFGSSPSV